MELLALEQWTKDHEKADQERFEAVERKLDTLPDDVKVHLNGSVEKTVESKMNQFKWDMFRWFGFGGLVILVGIGVAWGTFTERVGGLEDDVREIKGDIKTLIQRK